MSQVVSTLSAEVLGWQWHEAELPANTWQIHLQYEERNKPCLKTLRFGCFHSQTKPLWQAQLFTRAKASPLRPSQRTTEGCSAYSYNLASFSLTSLILGCETYFFWVLLHTPLPVPLPVAHSTALPTSPEWSHFKYLHVQAGDLNE